MKLRRIVFIILFLFAVPCSGANWFVDTNLATGSNDGTTTDDAYQSIKTAMDSAGYSAGDKIWIKRDSGYDEGVLGNDADINLTENDGVEFIGWPRAALSVTEADFTNGSAEVDNILPASMTLGTVGTRWITAPDGFDYLITKVTDTNTITIDRPYQGTTVTDTDGACTIKADEDYTEAQAIDDSAWTIKLSTWTDDSDEIPVIDFNDEAYQLNDNARRFVTFKNLYFKESTDSYGVVNSGYEFYFKNVIIYNDNNSALVRQDGVSYFDQCLLIGSSAGASQRGIIAVSGKSNIKNSAIYNCGDNGLRNEANDKAAVLSNVNIGVEGANGDVDYYNNSKSKTYTVFKDVKTGGTNGTIDYIGTIYYLAGDSVISVNHNKVLGAYYQYFRDGMTAEKVAVSGETPNKKVSDDVIKLTLTTNSSFLTSHEEAMFKVFESRKTYDAGTHNVKVWIYNDTGATLNDTTATDDIMLRCRSEAAGYGDATTEYVSKWYYSDEIDILDAADADDWDYLQADSVVVDVNDAHIYCEVLVSFYDAEADNVFIDPVTVNP